VTASRQVLSLALIVKNEARCIARCLGSIHKVVDEIVVVDTGSTDDTVEIARGFGARIERFSWIDDFAAARNYSLQRATGDWILVLDADEYASESLGREIREFIQRRPAVGRLKIVSEFRQNGQLLRSQSFVSRLFPRGARFEGRIHEQIVSDLTRMNLSGELWHDGYLEVQKSDRNVRMLETELARAPGHVYYLFQLAIEYSSLDQPDKAFDCLKRAFDGAQLTEPFAPNLVVDYLYGIMQQKQFAAGLQVIARTGSMLDDFPDFHLACGLFYMNLVRNDPAKHIAHLPRIEASFRRCLELGDTDKYKSVRGTGTFLAHYNLGTFYHVFGETAPARQCFEAAAAAAYEPAVKFLKGAT
jgi:glycosyltransferase involved in cell wall biosynthesis